MKTSRILPEGVGGGRSGIIIQGRRGGQKKEWERRKVGGWGRKRREGNVPICNGFGTSRLLPFTYSDLRYASGYLSSSPSA